MHKIKISNEYKLIFFCTRLKIDSAIQKKIKELLNSSINWDKIIEIYNYHQVLPLLYYNLTKLNFQDFIPQDIYSILKNSYYINLNRNIRFYRELSCILELTNRALINVVLLKGINLIETIYRNLALRTIVDIDILVTDSELMSFRALLFQLGYREIIKNFSPAYIQKHRITFSFIKSISPNLSLYIDIHRALVPPRPYKIDLSGFWERSQTHSIDGQKILFLSFEDTLLSLALHLRGHMRQPLLLKSICDIAELLNRYGTSLDWQYIHVTAKKNRMANDIYFAIYISKELLDACISSELLNKFKPGVLKVKLIHLCMNKYNFLEAKIWQGILLRFLLFDKPIDFILYLWRVSFLERFIARGDLRKIFTEKINKKVPPINTTETTKK